MYNSLEEYLNDKKREGEFYKRKLNLLLIAIERKHSDEDILDALTDITNLKRSLEDTGRDYLYLYLSSCLKINPLIVMLLLNMKCKISKPSDFCFYQKVIVNKDELYNEEEINFLSDVFYNAKKEKSP